MERHHPDEDVPDRAAPQDLGASAKDRKLGLIDLDMTNNDRNRSARWFGRERGVYAALTALLFCAFSYQLWLHAVRTSATIDEPAHTVAGYEGWRCGDFGINPEHPPLLKLLATAPLNFRSLAQPKADCGTRLVPKSEASRLGGEFLVANGIDSVLVPARLLAALLSLALAVLVFFATREMFGRWAALTALAILAFAGSTLRRNIDRRRRRDARLSHTCH